ncbi:DDE-type integrase/transposase/recombinase, partial [Shigella flexneri]|nr:DDE-type integrase/transposase/recombinase [Shigella flexneri]
MDNCDVCLRAKQTRDVFPDSINRANCAFELIHCDVWGPYRVKSSCGAAYFLTIVDDFSRAVWTYLLVEKSEVGSIIPNFCAMIVRQFGLHVKMVQSDNGGEFISLRSYFVAQGIVHRTSVVYTPQHNGRVERKHHHILNVARCLKIQAGMPIDFWGECVLIAAYLINRLPPLYLRIKPRMNFSMASLRSIGFCVCLAVYATHICNLEVRIYLLSEADYVCLW